VPILTGSDDAGLPLPIRASADRELKTADGESANVLSEILAELRAIRELAEVIVHRLDD